MNFYKYQANGNDFILTEDPLVDVEVVCDRHFGIGADGVLLVKIVEDMCEYTHYNADGSFASFCGNGICCVADWLMKQQESDTCKIRMQDVVYELFYNEEDVVLKVHCPELLAENTYRCGVIHVVADEQVQMDTYNLNFAEVVNRTTLRVQTLEKGVGWTLSCGSGNIVSFYHYFIQNLLDDAIRCVNEGGYSQLWIEDTFVYYAMEVEEVFVGVLN